MSCIEKDKRIAEQAEDLAEVLTLCHRFSKRIADLKKEIAELETKVARRERENEAAWDSAEHNARRAETAETEASMTKAAMGRLNTMIEDQISRAETAEAKLVEAGELAKTWYDRPAEAGYKFADELEALLQEEGK